MWPFLSFIDNNLRVIDFLVSPIDQFLPPLGLAALEFLLKSISLYFFSAKVHLYFHLQYCYSKIWQFFFNISHLIFKSMLSKIPMKLNCP